VAVPVGRVTVEHRHYQVLAARELRQSASDFDYLLVLGGSGVELFDGKFFAAY
jgi:hypothetical protein